MTRYMDYTSPTVQFSFDVNDSTMFKKDDRNFINVLSVEQLNTLDNLSLLDIYMSKENIVEPHYHQNASELVYCICGSLVVSIINPFTNELLHFPLTPGKVANVPQGWWHYEIATADDTHLLAIFNAPIPEVILGSDILRLTPKEVLSHSYCLDNAQLTKALQPLRETVFIGPPADCNQRRVREEHEASAQPYAQEQLFPAGFRHPSQMYAGPAFYGQPQGMPFQPQPYFPQQPQRPGGFF